MNQRDKMHPNKARRDSPEMRLAFLDCLRVVAPRSAWPAARNDHLTALREVPVIGWLIGITDRKNCSLTMRPTHVHRRAAMSMLISKTATTLMALTGLGDTVRLKPAAYAKYDRR